MNARRITVVALSVVVAGAVTLGVLFNASFQTWAVRRALAGRPELHFSVGRVAAGLRHVDLRDVEYASAGVRVHAPAVAVDLPLLPALFAHRWEIHRVVAKGWVVELDGEAPTKPADGSTAASSVPSGSPGASGEAGFRGVLPKVDLPVEIAVEAVDLAGKFVAPKRAVAANLEVTGGGLRAGRVGTFKIASETILAERSVQSVKGAGILSVTLGSPRSIAKLEAEGTATAAGGKLATPVVLKARASIARAADGEAYALSVVGPDRDLVTLQATFPNASGQISGNWRLDVRDTDVEPFTLGRAIPAFTATGEGGVEALADLVTAHVVGRMNGRLDRLGTVKPEFNAIGALAFTAELDLAWRDRAVSVDKLQLELGTDHPVVLVRSLQPFAFNAATRDVLPSDAARELFDIVLEGVPLAWARPFLAGITLEGNDAHGEFVGTPRAHGFSLKSKAPLTITGLAVARGAQRLLRDIDVAMVANADCTPQGWQAEVTGVTMKSAGKTVLLLDSKAGQLTGDDQPIKATGLLSVDLTALAAQPIAAGRLSPLERGDATIEFSASLGKTRAFDATMAIKNLAAASAAKSALPTLTVKVRADVKDGVATVNVPIVLKAEGRESDLTVVGQMRPAPAGHELDAQVTSTAFVVDDAKLLAALLPAGPRRADAPDREREGHAPGWTGLKGSLGLRLKKVVYSGTLEMNNVTGTLRFSGAAMQLENVRAGVGEGEAKVNGAVRFEPASARPFALGADLALADYDPGPLFMTVNPRQAPTVEGKFSISTKLSARAVALVALPAAASGQFALTSRGGTFRGLPVNVGNLVENSGKLASWFAAAGNAITSLVSRKDYDEITSRSQAANELARILSAIPYDQLSVVVTRDEALNTSVKEITLISPDIRISGTGTARSSPGRSPLNDVVALEYRVRARGRAAELMKFLGVLEADPDDLGYSGCTLPFRVGGTLSRIDATDVSNRLVALAVEKTGLTEKAVDWINRLRGK